MTDIARFRGDDYSVIAYVTRLGVAEPIAGWTFKLTCADHENPSEIFNDVDTTGTLGAGTDTDTAAAVGAFAATEVGDLFHNTTRDLFAHVSVVTSDDEVELDKEVTGQVSGDSFQVGDSGMLYQIDGIILDAAAGKVEFPFTEAEADHVGSYWFDVRVIDGAGKKATLNKGRMIYDQNITK